MMPVLFSQADYKTTVYDPPYAGYQEWPDLSIYKDYPGIRAFHMTDALDIDMDYYTEVETSRRRSFFMYSIFKTAPVAIQPFIYDSRTYDLGQYLSADEAIGVPWNFYIRYSGLSTLPNFTRIEDSDENTFMCMDNDTAHDGCELQLPDYRPTLNINNKGLETGYRYDADGNILHFDHKNDGEDAYWSYHGNMAAILLLGKWMDYLKQNGVYDNTRIIIASDHGFYLGDFDNMVLNDGTDAEGFSALLMYKDFDAKEFNISNEFMSHADVPALSTKGLFEKAVNPFTGKEISSDIKSERDLYVTGSHIYSRDVVGESTTFITDDKPWYSVHDSIYDKANWTPIEDPSKK